MKFILLFILLSSAMALFAFQSPAPKSESRRYINLPNRRDSLPFSDAVMVGDTLYLSGRIGLDPKTGKLAATPEDEARFILDGMKAVLAEAGMTLDDLVYVQVYCANVQLFDRWNKVYLTYFSSKQLPARAFIGSGPLLFEANFEMQAIAAKK